MISHHWVAGKQLKWGELKMFCSRSKHSPQIDPNTSSYSEITYHPLHWGAGQQLLLFLLWGRRPPVSCRGVAVVVCKGPSWSAGRKKGTDRYGHGDWWKSGTKPGRKARGQLGWTRWREKTLLNCLLWKAKSRHCLRDRWKCFQKRHLQRF